MMLIVIPISAYFLPTIVAAARKHPNERPDLVINLFTGWTGLGWIIALAWSFTAIAKPVLVMAATQALARSRPWHGNRTPISMRSQSRSDAGGLRGRVPGRPAPRPKSETSLTVFATVRGRLIAAWWFP